MIAEWAAQLDLNSLLLGLFAGLLIALVAAWVGARRGAGRASERLLPDIEKLETSLADREQALAGTSRELAIVETRLEEQQGHFRKEKASLEEAEKRLTEAFERLAGKVFDERSKRFTELSEKQLGQILKPLTRDIDSFRGKVEESHKEDIRQHAALQERLKQLEGLNEQLNEEAKNLTRALTRDVKAQGNWGEQQLERLMELAGLRKGENYHTQLSVTGPNGERLQPDLVLLLPEGRTIVIDSKVSLTAWTRLQAAEDEAQREALLAEHIVSIRSHIDGLGQKNYPGAEDLNALDFVLMFVPIEAALIAALQSDPTLPEHSLNRRVALLSPSNFLATVRTVASVWQIHKQNTNAKDIAQRAGFLYDKFVGFTENLRAVGTRLEQARKAYDDAYSQLSTGAGNLVGQTEKLRQLGAKHTKQLEAALVEKSIEEESPDDSHLRLVKPEDSDEASE
jgi:DNA recombination protein RmuC